MLGVLLFSDDFGLLLFVGWWQSFAAVLSAAVDHSWERDGDEDTSADTRESLCGSKLWQGSASSSPENI